MNAEILCFGSELLHGDIANTNAQYLSKQLAQIGINVYYHSVVGDNHKRMEEAFKLAFGRTELVICTGGLGPTQDDITKEILAKYNNVDMVYDIESYNHVKNLYKSLTRKMPESNIRQAYFPKGSMILHNDYGTANGCIMDINGKIAVLLPGPPKEVIPMMENKVLPYLMKYSDGIIFGKKYIIMGVGESTVEKMVIDLIENQTNPTLATFAGNGRVVLRVTAKAASKEEAEKMIQPIEDEIKIRMGKNLYLSDVEDVAEYSAKLLIKNNLTVSTAESCTGGLVATKLINFPGISSVFSQGFITYSNKSKVEILGVNEETLNEFGAVSKETVEEMAKNVALKSGSDIGLATTGIAGPTGGSLDKPVGLIYVCVYFKGNIETLKLNYPGQREINRERAALSVLDLMNKMISKEKKHD